MTNLMKLGVLLLVFSCCETRKLPDTMELINRLQHDIGQRGYEPPKLHPSEQDLRRLNARDYKHEDLTGLVNLLIKLSQQDDIEQRNWFTEDGAMRGTSTPVDKTIIFDTTLPTSTSSSTTTTQATPTSTSSSTTATQTTPTSQADLWKLIAKLIKSFG